MRFAYVGVFAFLVLSQFAFVSASSFSSSVDGFISPAEPLFRALLGDVQGVEGFSSGEILFAKLLVTILLITIIYQVVRYSPFQLGRRKNIAFFISLIVALLSVRYLNEAGFFLFIWLPYGALGIMISTLLPLVIGFFFIESFDTSLFRKIGWTLFAVVFLFLALLRWDVLAVSSGFLGLTNLAWIYVAVSVISASLIIFDGQARVMLHNWALGRSRSAGNSERAAHIHHEIIEAERRLRDFRAEPQPNEISIRTTEREIERLKEERKRLLRGE